MQAFSGIRVIDLTHVIAGPFCTYQLGVLGADVIKVEPPQNPDISRVSDQPTSGKPNHGTNFTAQNGNKRGICIDLKKPQGQEVMKRLLAQADVLVENYRSGAMAAVGFDYPVVKAIRPDIIYCSLTGFGQDGPIGERTAYDNIIQAYSGLMAATGDEDTAPLKVGPPVLDYGTGIQAAFAIAAALYQRTLTGRGQYIDIAMLDAAIMLMSSQVTYFHEYGELAPLGGNNSTVNAGYCCYATRDGLLMLGAYNGAQARNLWAVLGDPDHGETLRALTPPDMAAHFARDERRIAALLLAKTAAEWEHELNQNCVPAARVRELDEALADPQLEHRAVLQSLPGESAQKLPVAAFKYAENGPRLHSPPPDLGQHTEAVLREIGYSDDELTALQAQGAIKIADRV